MKDWFTGRKMEDVVRASEAIKAICPSMSAREALSYAGILAQIYAVDRLCDKLKAETGRTHRCVTACISILSYSV